MLARLALGLTAPPTAGDLSPHRRRVTCAFAALLARMSLMEPSRGFLRACGSGEAKPSDLPLFLRGWLRTGDEALAVGCSVSEVACWGRLTLAGHGASRNGGYWSVMR